MLDIIIIIIQLNLHAGQCGNLSSKVVLNSFSQPVLYLC